MNLASRPVRGARAFAACIALGSFCTSSAQDSILIYDGTTEYTGRLAPLEENRIIQKIPAYMLDGVDCLVGVSFWLQDQDCSTAEDYFVEVLPDDGFGAPDPSSPLVVDGPFRMGASGGTCFEKRTHLLSSQLCIPCGSPIYLCVRVPGNAGYPLDGLTIHTSGQFLDLSGNPHSDREAPRGDLASPISTFDLSWWQAGSGPVWESNDERLWKIAGLFDGPTLQPFSIVTTNSATGLNGRPDFGQAALYPETWDSQGVGRFDTIGWLITSEVDIATGNAALLMFSSGSAFDAGLPCTSGGAKGYLGLNFTDPLFGVFPFTVRENGSGQFMFGPTPVDPGTAALMNQAGFEFYAQGVIVRPVGVLDFTNISRTSF